MHLQAVSPIDGSIYQERSEASAAEVDASLERARVAQREWCEVSLDQRIAAVGSMVEQLIAAGAGVPEELSRQMGRPISQGGGELRGVRERSDYLLSVAPQALADVRPDPKAGFERWIRPRPLGVVAVLAPWNYPFLTAINSIVPALVAGNAVILKHSPQTPLVAERFSSAAGAAGLPEGVFQHLHLDHPATGSLVADGRVNGVVFTGSVEGGLAISRAMSQRFVPLALELGGKDAAYVRSDADLEFAAENIADGVFFNCGQSCCAIERVYVQRDLYRPFLEAFLRHASALRLGNPLDTATTLGPLVRTAAAERVRAQVRAACEAGARVLLGGEGEGAYLPPQVLVDVDHSMDLMREETFGPAIGIMAVESDAEAVRLINDSRYGLTASLWSSSSQAAQLLGPQLEVGTVFLNRCDYLDPALAWVGVKDSGRGCSLSQLSYAGLTRPQSFHFRIKES